MRRQVLLLTELFSAYHLSQQPVNGWIAMHSSTTTSASSYERVTSFTASTSTISIIGHQRQHLRHFALAAQILGAEFEQVPPEEIVVPYVPSTIESPVRTAETIHNRAKDKSWLEWSLEADPDFNTTRIPFFSDSTTCIDVKLAFLVELDGETYGIGTPFDHAVALTVEKSDGSIEYVSPDNDDNEELMEIMAGQLSEHVSTDLQLLRTPRVLTIRGPLEQYTKNWNTELFPPPLSPDQLLDESDESVQEFHQFMKQELGVSEYERTIRDSAGDDASERIPDELRKLFDIPGLGDREDDREGIQELFDSLLEPTDTEEKRCKSLEPNVLKNSEGFALKIVSYMIRDTRNTYSLSNLLQPYVLVAKSTRVVASSESLSESESESESDRIRFELLTPMEEKLVIPRLETVSRQDLDRLGLQLLTNDFS